MAGVSKDAPVADPLELADFLLANPPAPPEPPRKPLVSELQAPPAKAPAAKTPRGSSRSKNTQSRLNAAASRAARKTTQDVALPQATLEVQPEVPTEPAASLEEDIFVPDPGLDALPPLPEPTTLPEALPLPGPVSAQGDGWSCSGGHQNTAQAKFCLECGSPREQQRKCPAGHVNPDAAKFCGECGSALVATASGSATMQALAMRSPSVAQELRPKPEHELTPQERAEREAQHAAALAAGQELPPLQYELPTGQTYLIHILEDGFTFAGQVWYRGQQLEFIVGSARWEQAQAWIGMDDWAQMAQYGKIYFRPGPWPGKRYSDALQPENQVPQLGDSDGKPAVKGPSQQELERAEQLEARRRNAVPAPSYR